MNDEQLTSYLTRLNLPQEYHIKAAKAFKVAAIDQHGKVLGNLENVFEKAADKRATEVRDKARAQQPYRRIDEPDYSTYRGGKGGAVDNVFHLRSPGDIPLEIRAGYVLVDDDDAFHLVIEMFKRSNNNFVIGTYCLLSLRGRNTDIFYASYPPRFFLRDATTSEKHAFIALTYGSEVHVETNKYDQARHLLLRDMATK